MRKTPSFWYPVDNSVHVISILLWPLTLIWRCGAALKHFLTSSYKSNIPVVTVGNITAGGTGKTPIVQALADISKQNGRIPVIRTRGYGGQTRGPYRVKSDDSAAEVGDEALLLSKNNPVVVAAHRGEGAKWIEENIPDCDLIIMDDGMQNPSIKPDCKIAVFNGRLGVGNAMLIPSGPLREGWHAITSCDAIMISGDDLHGIADKAVQIKKDIPIIHVSRRFLSDDLKQLKGKSVIAFAGIGDPNGFFDMLALYNCNILKTYDYPDHHPFARDEITSLKREAKKMGAELVTTEKDILRLDDNLAKDIHVIRLQSVFNQNVIDILPSNISGQN